MNKLRRIGRHNPRPEETEDRPAAEPVQGPAEPPAVQPADAAPPDLEHTNGVTDMPPAALQAEVADLPVTSEETHPPAELEQPNEPVAPMAAELNAGAAPVDVMDQPEAPAAEAALAAPPLAESAEESLEGEEEGEEEVAYVAEVAQPTPEAAVEDEAAADAAIADEAAEDLATEAGPQTTAPLSAIEAEELTPLPVNAVVAGKYVVQSQLHHGVDRNLYRVVPRRQQKCDTCGRLSSVDTTICEHCGAPLANHVPADFYLMAESFRPDALMQDPSLMDLRLYHPNLVPVVDFYTYTPFGKARYYAVAEPRQGVRLSQMSMPRPAMQVFGWAFQLADALDYL
ncbi:MAG: hypothetical protein ACJ78Q_16560, partial [Chloroflexia bacterium]